VLLYAFHEHPGRSGDLQMYVYPSTYHIQSVMALPFVYQTSDYMEFFFVLDYLFIAHEIVIYVTLNGMNEVNLSRSDMLPCVNNKGNNSYANSETVTDQKLFSCVQLLNSNPSESRICPSVRRSTGFYKFHCTS